ncbi:MAG: dynamin family protein [Bacteroidia bacterium]
MIHQDIHTYRGQIDEIVKELHALTLSISHEELARTLSDLRNRLHEPFMFVIVGEVKAGKSSFTNALLETQKEICKVSPAPCTDTIQQIMYGNQEKTVTVNPYLKQLFYPIEILKEIAIVDTPGTNTIIAHHQEITESFIPASDLIVFVFEAKNPYRQSSWEFFDYIHSDWRKKIIFILQQKDLMSEGDLAINVQGVKDAAQKKGISEPSIFAVSAKEELEGKIESSGFEAVRAYIQANITGGKAPLLKLQNNVEISINIYERIEKGLELRKAQFKADIDFRADVKQSLEHQRLKATNQAEMMVENLLAGYDKITRKTELELEEGLSFVSLMKRSFSAMFSSASSSKEWLSNLTKSLELELNQDLRNRLDDNVNDLADSIQQMAKMIDLKIKNSQTILKDNHEIFSDIAERRTNVLRDLQETFGKFMSRAENFATKEIFSENQQALTTNIAAGGSAAIIGGIIMAVTNISLFDITGGLLTGLGLLFAGFTVGVSRKRILEGYRNEIAKSRSQMNEEVTEKLNSYVKNIQQKIEANFLSFDAMLENEKMQLAEISTKCKELEVRLQGIQQELKNK